MIVNLGSIKFYEMNLLPFNKDELQKVDVLAFQQYCLDNNLFGIGWAGSVDKNDFETDINDKILLNDKYKEIHISKDKNVSHAINELEKIKENDYIFIRLRSDRYCIGRVVTPIHYVCDKNNEYLYYLSWGGKVAEWIIFEHSGEVPACMTLYCRTTIGRIASSERYLPLLQAMRLKVPKMIEKLEFCTAGKDKEKLESLIEEMVVLDKIFNKDIKQILTKDNFGRALKPELLEDLVAMYIYDDLENARLIPSTSKADRKMYEFNFVYKENNQNKVATCQVKNNADINVERYKDVKVYDRIYLFSGCWNDDNIKEKKAEYSDCKHLYLIDKEKLFETLKKYVNDKKGTLNNITNFYEVYNAEQKHIDNIDKESIIKIIEDVGVSSKTKSKKYWLEKESCKWISLGNVWYSCEFDCIVIELDEDMENNNLNTSINTDKKNLLETMENIVEKLKNLSSKGENEKG